MKQKDMPVGVKILAILAFIGAVADLLLGLGFIFGASALGAFFAQYTLLGAIGAGVIAVGGVVLILFAVLNFFIGKGLWKGQNWSRILVLIFVVIGAIGGLFSLISGEFSSIIGLAINGLIIWYLGFNQPVVKAFD